MQLMKFKVVYTQGGNRITEFCKTAAFAKKRAKQMGGTWAKLQPGE